MTERVLLVNASLDKDPIRAPHLGLTYLYAFLSEKGIETDVYDSRFDGVLMERIQQYSPTIVGFTTVTADLPAIKGVAREIIAANPDIQIVYGGVHATVRPQDVLQSSSEVVVSGEGENTFYQLIQQKARSVRHWEQIAGLRFLDGDLRLITTGDAPLVRDIDTLPMPSLERYFPNPQVNQFQLMTARGCPYKCDFCSSDKIWRRKLRMHSSARVVQEVQRLADHNISRFVFVDDTLTIDAKRLEEICSGILEIGQSLNWTANSRVDFFPRADRRMMLRKMKAAGCFLICFGVESGSQSVLDRVHKGITVEQAIEAIRLTQQEGISAKANLIVGLPGSFKDQLTIIDFVKEAQPDYVTLHNIMPLPGTSLLERAVDFGLQINEDTAVARFNRDVEPPVVGYKHSEYTLSPEQITEAMCICVEEIKNMGYTSDPHPGQRKIIKSPVDAGGSNDKVPQYFTLL